MTTIGPVVKVTSHTCVKMHGPVPGHAEVDLDGRWRVARKIEPFGHVNNLLDRRFAGTCSIGG